MHTCISPSSWHNHFVALFFYLPIAPGVFTKVPISVLELLCSQGIPLVGYMENLLKEQSVKVSTSEVLSLAASHD